VQAIVFPPGENFDIAGVPQATAQKEILWHTEETKYDWRLILVLLAAILGRIARRPVKSDERVPSWHDGGRSAIGSHGSMQDNPTISKRRHQENAIDDRLQRTLRPVPPSVILGTLLLARQ
jgi:hypothetical protein